MPAVVDGFLPIDRLDEERLTPREWGVDVDCFVRLEDPRTGDVRLLRLVEAGGTLRWSHAGGAEKLLLTFRRVASDGSPGGMLGYAHRWVPAALRTTIPASIERVGGSLEHTVRHDVTLTPMSRQLLGSGALTTRGYIGAWDADGPIAEAMDFALGRQYYNFRPREEASRVEAGTVIYLGPPQQGWGHFLTQGLSRLWFALQHPDVPVLWDAGELKDYQRETLELLGLRNEQRFLTETTVWDTVIFPFPGLCIGEFVLPEFAAAIGLIAPAPQQPGKRLFVSRSGLDAKGGSQELELDRLVERFGFEIFRPERHSVRAQLEELSSAEAVLGVEGSAFHTPLLLEDPIATRFWALTRHRGGSGVFEHLRRAKGMRYETLNFLASRHRGGHRSPLDLDLAALEGALEETEGLTSNLEVLAGRLERPWPGQTSYDTHLRHLQAKQTFEEELITRAQLALRGTQHNGVATMLRDAI